MSWGKADTAVRSNVPEELVWTPCPQGIGNSPPAHACVGEEREEKELCTADVAQDAAVMVMCSRGYMLQVGSTL